jgi:hypothetical protein
MKKDIEIFREENVPLKAEVQVESQKFSAISGAMTIVMRQRTYLATSRCPAGRTGKGTCENRFMKKWLLEGSR